MKADAGGPSRRAILKGGMAAATVLALPACETPTSGSSGGADMALGHRLRDGAFPEPVREERVPLLIAGGGVLVRVPLDGHLPVALFDRIGVRVLADSQDAVVVSTHLE